MNLPETYWTHRKTLALMRLLGRDAETAPLRLWAYVERHHGADGRLAGYTGPEIESAVGWWGGPGKLVAALEQVGWLERLADGQAGWQCHEWTQHQNAESLALEGWRRALEAQAGEVEALRGQLGATLELLHARDAELAREGARRHERERKQAQRDRARTVPGQASDKGRDRVPNENENDRGRKDEIPIGTNFDNGGAGEGGAAGRANADCVSENDGQEKAACKEGRRAEVLSAGGTYDTGKAGYGPNKLKTMSDWQAHVWGRLRRALRTMGDANVTNETGKDFCAEVDGNKGGNCWGGFWKANPEALDVALLEFEVAVTRRDRGLIKDWRANITDAGYLVGIYKKVKARMDQGKAAMAEVRKAVGR